MTADNPDSTTIPDAGPRPTQKAFEPTDGRATLSGLAIVGCCLLGFLLGIGGWVNDTIYATLDTVIPGQATDPRIFMCTFPLWLGLGIYFLWVTWRDWRETRLFNRQKQTGTAVITHLWKDETSGGKKNYVGYLYDDGAAFQTLHGRVYGRLTMGEELPVEFVKGYPRLSRVDTPKRPKKPRAKTSV
ncbi:MAG: hypothetical protein KJ069_01410 [Anaerolineae bacterium]|nr:hypothetical protein [Anaerolineae bacterium]